MSKKPVVLLYVSLALFVLFAVFTLAVSLCDVATVAYAPDVEAEIGFSSVNQATFDALGTSDFWYELTELLGILALAVGAAFALVGAFQLFKRKSLWKVDSEILLLAVFYVLVVLFYVIFEVLVINHRPVLIDGALEASYPSSHSMLATCIFASAPFAARGLVKNRKVLLSASALCALLIVLTLVGRLLSGVHWLTDILGALLLSAALVTLYVSALELWNKKASAED